MKTTIIAFAAVLALLLSGCTMNYYGSQLPPVPSPPQPPVGESVQVPPGNASPQPPPAPPLGANEGQPGASEPGQPVPAVPPAPAENASQPSQPPIANETGQPENATQAPPATNVTAPAANTTELPANASGQANASAGNNSTYLNASLFLNNSWWFHPVFLNFTKAPSVNFSFTMVQIDGMATTSELDDAQNSIAALEGTGNHKPGQIIVRQLLQKGKFELSEWRQNLVVNSQLLRRDVAVMLLNSENDAVGRWCFAHAWPSAFSLGGMDSQSAIYEYYVLDYEDGYDCT